MFQEYWQQIDEILGRITGGGKTSGVAGLVLVGSGLPGYAGGNPPDVEHLFAKAEAAEKLADGRTLMTLMEQLRLVGPGRDFSCAIITTTALVNVSCNRFASSKPCRLTTDEFIYTMQLSSSA